MRVWTFEGAELSEFRQQAAISVIKKDAIYMEEVLLDSQGAMTLFSPKKLKVKGAIGNEWRLPAPAFYLSDIDTGKT